MAAEAMKRRWPAGTTAPCEYPVNKDAREVFRKALSTLNRARVPYAVGGAFALHWYSGYWRPAKDLDLFVPPDQVEAGMRTLSSAGFATRVKHAEWLADAIMGLNKVDLIYGMGNWMSYVDEGYLNDARQALILGVRTRVAPPEEMVYSKLFVAGRDRCDSSDVFHLLVATAPQMDWDRLLRRFGEHWEVLLSHLILFQYVYPSHRDLIPEPLLDELLARFRDTRRKPWTGGKVCRGYLLDGNGAYAMDVKEWGYRDARQEGWEELQRRREAARDAAA